MTSRNFGQFTRFITKALVFLVTKSLTPDRDVIYGRPLSTIKRVNNVCQPGYQSPCQSLTWLSTWQLLVKIQVDNLVVAPAGFQGGKCHPNLASGN